MKKTIFSLFLVIHSFLLSIEPVILLFGPPGSGKGTFAQLAKGKGYNHLSAGDMIRDEIIKKTPYGTMVEEIVKRGDYVDRELLCKMINQKITEFTLEGKPFIIDGIGRSSEDMQSLFNILSELELSDRTLVLFLDADDNLCKERMSGRLVCNDCHFVYSSKYSRHYPRDACPNCQEGLLEERINDTALVIEKRIGYYREVIESNYKKSLEFFPAIFFNSGQDHSVCVEFYDALLAKLKAYEGELKDFVN
jgi:adenylate kinase